MGGKGEGAFWIYEKVEGCQHHIGTYKHTNIHNIHATFTQIAVKDAECRYCLHLLWCQHHKHLPLHPALLNHFCQLPQVCMMWFIKLSRGPVAMVEKLILSYEHLFCIKVSHLYMNHFHYDKIFILYVTHSSAYGSTNKRQQLQQYQFWHSDHHIITRYRTIIIIKSMQ